MCSSDLRMILRFDELRATESEQGLPKVSYRRCETGRSDPQAKGGARQVMIANTATSGSLIELPVQRPNNSPHQCAGDGSTVETSCADNPEDDVLQGERRDDDGRQLSQRYIERPSRAHELSRFGCDSAAGPLGDDKQEGKTHDDEGQIASQICLISEDYRTAVECAREESREADCDNDEQSKEKEVLEEAADRRTRALASAPRRGPAESSDDEKDDEGREDQTDHDFTGIPHP